MTAEDPHNPLLDVPPEVYQELKGLAHRCLARRGHGGPVHTTALVHEAYLKMARQPRLLNADRSQVLLAAACAMRSVLVDLARRRNARKRRPKGIRIALDEAVAPYEDRSADLLALDEAVQKLDSVDPMLGRLVVLRFFGGLTVQDTAQALHVSERTVHRDWKLARAWLRDALREAPDDES